MLMSKWPNFMTHIHRSSTCHCLPVRLVVLVTPTHYSEVIISAMASQITGVTIVYTTACSGTDQRKHQSSASLTFVRGIHQWTVNSPHKGPVTRNMIRFDDAIIVYVFPEEVSSSEDMPGSTAFSLHTAADTSTSDKQWLHRWLFAKSVCMHFRVGQMMESRFCAHSGEFLGKLSVAFFTKEVASG